jgi:hypothetical protein
MQWIFEEAFSLPQILQDDEGRGGKRSKIIQLGLAMHTLLDLFAFSKKGRSSTKRTEFSRQRADVSPTSIATCVVNIYS